MKTSMLIFLSSLFLCACQAPPVEEYTIIPQPQEISYTPGFFKMSNQPVISYSGNLVNEAQYLQNVLAADFSVNATLKEGKGDINLVLDPAVLADKPEGYQLEVASGKIAIKSSTPAGVLNGVQTLRQIIKEKDGKYVVQRAAVSDYPAFSWRAFMLDEGRYFKGKDVVLKLLDEMAGLKMNVFHWHLTNDQGWRIEIKKYPKLTEIGAFRDSSEINHFNSDVYDGKRHGGFYTQAEIKEIVDYASKRHITIVPEVSMPGHASAAIASYPWLGTSGKQIKVPGKFGVHYEVFNVSDPKVMQFFDDVTNEVIALFPGSVFHIGGDEVKYDQWKASPAIRNYMTKKGLKTPAELQVYFTNEISNMLSSKGKRMMGWNEITGDKLHEYQSAEDTKEVEQQLAKGTIVHFWKGDPALIKKTIDKGYDVVNSYHEYTYVDYNYESIPLSKAYAFDPVPEGLSPEEQSRVLGLGCQMWGEFIPTVESMNRLVYPRIAAYAETGWTGSEKKDYTRFLRSLDYFTGKWIAEGIVIGPTE
ncbi:beta-N-acetylhexosaminidase [uncultured Parabacteroides sp.]|jgi:hexosaminidase|uniref:beta-N-acetylhexosaminidase n=1 Tax=uncultured Parabacteroides sp. TaxID=512312 RepID=UPI0025D256D4|nr:beta-N-acetylhexosaminidase [uncultured Parabacteroides sp.]